MQMTAKAKFSSHPSQYKSELRWSQGDPEEDLAVGVKHHDWSVSAELTEEASWGSYSNQHSGLSWHRRPMLILFCCCFFFKLAAKDSVLLLMKPMGFGLCWSGWSAGRASSSGSSGQEASLWGRQCKGDWEPPASNPNSGWTSTSAQKQASGKLCKAGVTWTGCCSHQVTVHPIKRGAERQVWWPGSSLQGKQKWETVHQLGEEVWLLRLSSLCFGDSGTGPGRVRGKILLPQAAEVLCRDPPAAHIQTLPLLLGYFDCSERLKRQREEKLVLC